MYDSVIPEPVLALVRQCSNARGVHLLKWGGALGAGVGVGANAGATGVPAAVEALTKELCRLRHGELAGVDCQRRDYVGDVFFFSCLLFAGTFCFSYGFKLLRNSSFFTGLVRGFIALFSFVIALEQLDYCKRIVSGPRRLYCSVRVSCVPAGAPAALGLRSASGHSAHDGGGRALRAAHPETGRALQH